MNCTVVQRCLLSAERPEQPPSHVQDHLAHCPACRAWQRRLIRTEQLIAQLPVPASTAKELFLERIRRTGEKRKHEALIYPPTLALGPFKKERALRKLSVAFALAASLLLFALVWWSWPTSVTMPEPWQIEQAKLERRLNDSLGGNTPKERVLRLAKLADEVRSEAREWIDNSERLEQWSRFYSRIVRQHLIEQAQQVPPEERQAVLENIALRLAAAESEAMRLAAQYRDTAPRSAAAFQRIALVSQKGERDLRALLKG